MEKQDMKNQEPQTNALSLPRVSFGKENLKEFESLLGYHYYIL